MISMDLIFKVEGATRETTINLDIFLNTIESIRTTLNYLSKNTISYDFKHTNVSSFKISVDIYTAQNYGILFENRKEEFYNTYCDIVTSILEGSIPKNLSETRYKASIKKLFKTLAEQSEDVELIFENKENKQVKTVSINNTKVKNGYIKLKQYLSDTKIKILNIEGIIYDIALSKKVIGIKQKDSNEEIIEFKIDNIIASMFMKKEYELNDEVIVTLEKEERKRRTKLLYIKNITKNTTFPKTLFDS